ncbi:MAG: protein-L-isoaspartate O-methyltransferase family protein, partial [Chitinophagaceae bacterium]
MRRPTEDTYRHKGLRKKLVDTVKGKGITDERVLNAISNVPRHYFLDSAFDELAYEDRAFPIGEGQTISQPYTVAYQSQLLEVKPFIKVHFSCSCASTKATTSSIPEHDSAMASFTCLNESVKVSPLKSSVMD